MKSKDVQKIFNSVYDANYSEVYSYILAKTGDIESTPEILNDSFAAFYRQLISLRQDNIQNKRAYLYTIVRNNLAKYYKEKAEKSTDSLDSDEQSEHLTALIFQELSADFANPQSKAETKDLIFRILGMVSERPLAQRRAFILHFMFDFPIAKVAEELSISEACAGNYIYRLLKDIRCKFQTEYTGTEE